MKSLRWLPVLLLAASCAGEATQLVVVVETNLDVPMEIDEVVVAVTGPSGVSSATSEMLIGPTEPGFPLTVSVVPSGEALGPVTVVARGLLGGTEQVRTQVRTSLVEGRSKMVRLYLLRGCIGRPCDGQTCGIEGCMPVDVAGEDLPSWDEEGVEATDLSDPCLAGTWDADGDGQGAEACGGEDCDDTEERAYLGNVEDCDMVDNDCDGARDEECACTPEGIVEDCPTRCGSTGSHTCTDGLWTPCVAEEICTGADTDCDGITDEGFTYVEGPRTQISFTDSRSDEPHMVFAEGRFHVAWIDEPDGERDDGIAFISFDESGDTGGGMPVVVEEDAREPRLAWSGTGFGLSWFDPDTVSCGTSCSRTVRRLRFTTLDPNGVVVSPIEELDTNASQPVLPRIAWTGSEFGVAWNGGDIQLQLADVGGTPIGGRSAIEANSDGLDMVHTGAAYAFISVDNDEVRFNLGTPGTFADPSPVLHVGENDLQYPAVRETETGFFAAWADENGRLVNTAVLDERGNLVGTPQPLVVPMMRERLEARPQLAGAPGQVFVVFRAEDMMDEEDIYMARFAADGTVLQPPTRMVIPDEEYWPSPAWGTDRLGIAYIDRQADEQLWYTSFACP